MATSVTLTSVQLPPDGAVFINFSNGTQLEYASRSALAADVASVANAEWCRLALVAHWLALNPALDDPSHVNGKTLEANLASVLNPVTIGVV